MDEFYSLIERHQDGTPDMIGMEAVNQLLVALEAHRFDFCFIGAGYEDQVDEFLTVNPGLAGRFNRKLRFESYSPDEMVEIAIRYGKPRATVLEDAAGEALEAAYDLAHLHAPNGQHGIDVMQNGRFARNVVERAERLRDSRVAAQNRTDQGSVTVEDLQITHPGRARRHQGRVCGKRVPITFERTAAPPVLAKHCHRYVGSNRKTASRPASASNSSAVPSRTIPDRFANATPTGTSVGNARSTGRASSADSSTILTCRDRRPRAQRAGARRAGIRRPVGARDSRPPRRGRPRNSNGVIGVLRSRPDLRPGTVSTMAGPVGIPSRWTAIITLFMGLR